MKPEYEQWIAAWVATCGGYVNGRCLEGTRRMVEAFPELTAVPGFAVPGGEHVWCVTKDGEIVDPTRSQYPHEIEYRPFQPGDEVRVGKCMECGTDIYLAVDALNGPRVYFCDDDCERSHRAYLEHENKR